MRLINTDKLFSRALEMLDDTEVTAIEVIAVAKFKDLINTPPLSRPTA